MAVGATAVLVDSMEHLIAMKRAANRDKDQRHIMELQAMLKIAREQED